MSTLVEELRSDSRCGCYADGAGTPSRPAVSHHCLTCRAADRIEELERQKDELLVRVLSQCRGDCTAAAKGK